MAISKNSALEPTEHQLQCALIDWCNLQAMAGIHPELALIYAIPNSGAGGQSGRAGWLKAEGVKAGVPDLYLPVARSGFHGLYLETKARRGRLSEDQKFWFVRLRAEGYAVCLWRDLATAESIIDRYLSGKLYGARYTRPGSPLFSGDASFETADRF